MRRQVVYWKPIRSRNIYGEIYLNRYFPQVIDGSYKGELLFEILSMTPKNPISFEDAVNQVEAEFRKSSDAGHRGTQPGQSHWFYENFVKWISDQGLPHRAQRR